MQFVRTPSLAKLHMPGGFCTLVLCIINRSYESPVLLDNGKIISVGYYMHQSNNSDYIINLYGVKDSTMSNSKCAKLFLSCLLSFYTISMSLILYFEEFFSSLPSFFMHACIHKVQWILGGKGPRPLKQFSFCQINGDVSIWRP